MSSVGASGLQIERRTWFWSVITSLILNVLKGKLKKKKQSSLNNHLFIFEKNLCFEIPSFHRHQLLCKLVVNERLMMLVDALCRLFFFL